jgi:hypothetical protein
MKLDYCLKSTIINRIHSQKAAKKQTNYSMDFQNAVRLAYKEDYI